MRVLTAAPREERKLLGILLILAGVVCLTLVDSAAKWLVQSMACRCSAPTRRSRKSGGA